MSTREKQDVLPLHRGRFLELVSQNDWEYVRRVNASGVVAIVPVHSDGRVVLVEQHRPAAGGAVIEWPAGLVGDEGDDESHLEAAKRELLEETGYTARQWERIGEGLSSAGLTDEAVVFYAARNLEAVNSGGGVGGEEITTHEVALDEVHAWLKAIQDAGKRVDVKVYTGLAMLYQYLKV